MGLSYLDFTSDETDRVLEVAADRARYWRGLALSGYEEEPFADRTGRLVTFEHVSAPEAQRFAADPFRGQQPVASHRLKVWAVQ
jgi:hypothetical protein